MVEIGVVPFTSITLRDGEHERTNFDAPPEHRNYTRNAVQPISLVNLFTAHFLSDGIRKFLS